VVFAINEMMIGNGVHRMPVLKYVDVTMYKYIIKFA
jgi:hypothetical protein